MLASALNSRSAWRALLGALLLVAAGTARGDDLDVWKKSNLQALILGPVRLNLAFADQAGTPRVALVPSLSPQQLDGMPEGLIKAKDSPLLRAGYFQSLWDAMRGAICSDMQQNIQRIVNRSPNTAYDIQLCVMDPKAYLVATFQTSWESEQFQQVAGRRVILNMTSPLNGITFWVTGPGTCHRGDNCPTEPTDHAFTVVFTANLTLTCAPTPTPAVTAFQLPISCQPAASIDVEDVIGGDLTGDLKAAVNDFATQVIGEAGSVVVTAGGSAPEAAAAFVGGALKVAVKGLGTAIAGEIDKHLRDEISSWIIGFVGSGTLKANAQTVAAEFNDLFQNLYHAQLGGLRPFLVGIGPGLGLDFSLVYPPPAKPKLENTTAAGNAGSIIAPTIAVSQPEVMAGQVLPVTASNFRGTYVNAIKVGWNQTVLGKPRSSLEWGPPPVTITTLALTFDATNLKPATGYGFRVHECDGLTCAPWSDLLATKTEPAGSNIVAFWLDSDKAHPIGGAQAPAGGGNFIANVKIPPGTAPGPHKLYASVFALPPASADITVCQPGGCAATVAVLNTSNNTLYPSGAFVEVSTPVVLRGSHFAPGGAVAIFVDTAKGPRAGTAPVGPLGNFQASFTMPLIPAGSHKFLALEAKPGTAPPHLQFIQASVGVYVQAMAQ